MRAMIDLERIDDLEHEIGAGVVAEIVALYVAEARDKIDELSDGDPDARRRAAHFLRSGALNIGLTGMARLAARGPDQDGDDGAGTGSTSWQDGLRVILVDSLDHLARQRPDCAPAIAQRPASPADAAPSQPR